MIIPLLQKSEDFTFLLLIYILFYKIYKFESLMGE